MYSGFLVLCIYQWQYVSRLGCHPDDAFKRGVRHKQYLESAHALTGIKSGSCTKFPCAFSMVLCNVSNRNVVLGAFPDAVSCLLAHTSVLQSTKIYCNWARSCVSFFTIFRTFHLLAFWRWVIRMASMSIILLFSHQLRLNSQPVAFIGWFRMFSILNSNVENDWEFDTKLSSACRKSIAL